MNASGETAPARKREPGKTKLVLGLGTTQTLAWASSYYLVAFIAGPQAHDIGVSISSIFAAFTAAMLVAAMVGPQVGRTIDLLGGREVLIASNLLFAAGLGLLGAATSAPILWLGWLVVGAGMGLGLYDAAFAALGRIYGSGARSAITGITLLAGFASTVGWPLTAWGIETQGWRPTCFGWAIAHLLFGLPLNMLVVPRLARRSPSETDQARGTAVGMDRNMWLLGFSFSAGWMVAAALAAHLPRLLEISGADRAQILLASMLLGPAQVAARALEATLLARVNPLFTARICMLAHPVGAGLVLMAGGIMAVPFMLLHGCGQGILTVARGTVPLAVFGPQNYGFRLGLLGAPTRIAQAFAPLGFSLIIDLLGAMTLILTSAICIAASLALLGVRMNMPVEVEADRR